MAIGTSIRLKAEVCREVTGANVEAAAGNYLPIGTAMAHPVRIFYLQNLTDATLWFSFDGVNNTIPLPANGHFTADITANKSQDSGFYLAKGDRIYAKRLGVATAGSVYLTVLYGS